MPQTTVKLPSMGEGITDATIIRWLAKEGDTVKFDQVLVEIATDKVDSEITSPTDGLLVKILAEENTMPKVGEVIAIIVSGEDALNPDLLNIFNQEASNVGHDATFINKTKFFSDENKNVFIPPFIRLAAEQLNISFEEIMALHKGIPNKILTKNDLLDYIEFRKPQINVSTIAPTPIKKAEKQPVIPESDEYTIGEMSRMRKIISSRMKDSVNTAPHVTSFIECDVTDLVLWFGKNRKTFDERNGFKLTMSAFFIDAVAQTLKQYPEVNASIKGEYILYKKPINIGFAVMLDNNELIVPVIKNADQLSLQGVGQRLLELTTNARENNLQAIDIQGSTFTITNLGRFGTLTGTPIINQPDSAIMAFGAIIKKPAVVNVDGQLTIGIRDIIMLSHTYDHRIIDGGLGGRFLKSVSDYLTNFKGDMFL